MSLATIYPHIEEVPGGPARLRRSPRIRVAQIVMDYLAHGWSVEEMCRHHATLTPAEAHSAMAYYFDHQSTMDAEIRHELEQVDRDRATAPLSPFLVRMRAQGKL